PDHPWQRRPRPWHGPGRRRHRSRPPLCWQFPCSAPLIVELPPAPGHGDRLVTVGQYSVVPAREQPCPAIGQAHRNIGTGAPKWYKESIDTTLTSGDKHGYTAERFVRGAHPFGGGFWMFELISAAMRRKRPPTHGLFDTVSMEFRVGLTDLDLNLHLNNAKYLKFMDRC